MVGSTLLSEDVFRNELESFLTKTQMFNINRALVQLSLSRVRNDFDAPFQKEFKYSKEHAEVVFLKLPRLQNLLIDSYKKE